ncbi:hypothetical protein ACVFYP_00530 [Roseomonas sp. F4]
MGAIRTILLTDEQIEAERRLTEAGIHVEAGEIFSAGLRALAEEAVVERIIREQIDPVAEAMLSDPADALPADQVFRELRARLGTR